MEINRLYGVDAFRRVALRSFCRCQFVKSQIIVVKLQIIILVVTRRRQITTIVRCPSAHK